MLYQKHFLHTEGRGYLLEQCVLQATGQTSLTYLQVDLMLIFTRTLVKVPTESSKTAQAGPRTVFLASKPAASTELISLVLTAVGKGVARVTQPQKFS
jgi:hypothetical protein